MKATAFVVGDEAGRGGALKRLAREARFEAVYMLERFRDAELESASMPLIFFLFAETSDFQSIAPTAGAVRGSPSPRLRFAPMIYFCEAPSAPTIRACVNMAFDDIITLPFELDRIEERLTRQVERPLVYYETETYFGPDRRNCIAPELVETGRGSGGTFRRMEIVRTPGTGVSLVRDEMHVAA